MEPRPLRRRSEVAIAVAGPPSAGGAPAPFRLASRTAWRGALVGLLLGAATCAGLFVGPRDLLLRRAAAAATAAATAAFSPPPSAPLPCAAGGLCSLPRVRAWHGDLGPSPNLRAALKARAHRGELVLLCTTDAQSLDVTLQPVAQLARLGMAHHLLLADGPGTCEAARGAVAAVVVGASGDDRGTPPITLGCGWYGDGDGGGDGAEQLVLPRRVQGAFRLWALRMRTALRAVRLGYNVLVLDADTVLFGDPYPYLKHAALLGSFHWLSQPESGDGDAEGRGGFLNGGVYYVQNAAPSGPAAFLLYESVRRMLRWDDDGRATLRSYWRVGGEEGGSAAAAAAAVASAREEAQEEHQSGRLTGPPAPPSCCDADQDLLNDVFKTMRTGTLTSACAIRCALAGTWKQRRRGGGGGGGEAEAAADGDGDGEGAPDAATRARLEAALQRIEDVEAGCDDYWRQDALSAAPEWAWPVIYGPTSAGFPEDEVAAAMGAAAGEEEGEGEEEQTAQGRRRRPGSSDGGGGGDTSRATRGP